MVVCAYVGDIKPEASIHLLSRPEHILPKCTSFSSVESDQSEGQAKNGMLTRAGTMSEGALVRKDSNKSVSRPKSEIPVGYGGRELEASFEVSELHWCNIMLRRQWAIEMRNQSCKLPFVGK